MPVSMASDSKITDKKIFGWESFLTASRTGLVELCAAESEGSVKPEHSKFFRGRPSYDAARCAL